MFDAAVLLFCGFTQNLMSSTPPQGTQINSSNQHSIACGAGRVGQYKQGEQGKTRRKGRTRKGVQLAYEH